MALPSHKPESVQDSTVTARAKNFHSVQYLLVHGTADGELCNVFSCITFIQVCKDLISSGFNLLVFVLKE